MKPPSRIKLGGQDWSVDVVKLDPDLCLYGRTRARQASIELDMEQAPTQLRDTLLHEVIHAGLTNVGLSLSTDDEERIVRGITPWLLAALRDNSRLVEFLTER